MFGCGVCVCVVAFTDASVVHLDRAWVEVRHVAMVTFCMPVKVDAIHETRVDAGVAGVTGVMARGLLCFKLAYVIIFFS